MLIKLGRLNLPAIEMGCPDLSLLTPEEQDRVWELFRKSRNSLDPGITLDELRELEGLLAKVPILRPGEKFAGPKIEVPRALVRYWDWVKPAAGGRGYWFPMTSISRISVYGPQMRPMPRFQYMSSMRESSRPT
jgi:hypothetical protein